jgi:DNA-binding NtrC family response regulator
MAATTRILLINSERTFRLLLQFRGYETAVASSYQEAREMLAADRFDLIIVQIEFEREAALRFCDELKQSHPQLKIALLAHHTLYFPPSACPDDVIVRQDGPGQFLQQVEQLVAAA